MSLSVLTLISRAETLFTEHGIDSPRLNAEELLAHVMGMDRFHLYLEPEIGISKYYADSFSELIKQRINNVPLQHLVGVQHFRDLELMVGDGVFIPRPETEMLVEYTNGLISKISGDKIHCLDVGTGSCAIPLSLVQENDNVWVDTVEISWSACLYAEKNLERYQDLAGRINLIKSDFLHHDKPGYYDIVVSNPPYIPDAEIDNLPADVREGDPIEALCGGSDGLDLIRVIIQKAKSWLRDGGWLIMEIGDNQDGLVNGILDAEGYSKINARPDLTGRARFVLAGWSGCKN